MELVTLAEEFHSPAVYAIYQFCMYQPTPAKFSALAAELLSDGAARLCGCRRNGTLTGVLALRVLGDEGTIAGIAVDGAWRGKGVGSFLVYGAMKAFHIEKLYAETDREAVEFYRKCGFSAEAFTKTYGGRAFTRYACVLKAADASRKRRKIGTKD